MANFVMIKQAVHPNHATDDWHLCLQWGLMQYGRGRPPQWGYRLIWRRPDGSLQARGAALMESRADLAKLWDVATAEGWGDYDAADPGTFQPAETVG